MTRNRSRGVQSITLKPPALRSGKRNRPCVNESTRHYEQVWILLYRQRRKGRNENKRHRWCIETGCS